jgi:hypothetical protein
VRCASIRIALARSVATTNRAAVAGFTPPGAVASFIGNLKSQI